MSFDLSTLDAGNRAQEDGITVDIKHPVTQESLGIKIVVASYDSEKVKAVARAMGNKALLQQKRNPRKADTVEAIEERTFEIAAAAVVSWDGIEMNGQPFPFTRENALTLLKKYFWITEQIDAVASDRAAFFTNSQTNSAKQ